MFSGAKAMASHTAATPASGVPFYSQALGNCVSTTDCEPHLESESKELSTERRRQELRKEQFHKLPTELLKLLRTIHIKICLYYHFVNWFIKEGISTESNEQIYLVIMPNVVTWGICICCGVRPCCSSCLGIKCLCAISIFSSCVYPSKENKTYIY